MAKFPKTNQSTLLTTAAYDPKLNALRKRAGRIGYDVGRGLCRECDAQLTQADVEAGACTQCGALLDTIDEIDRSERLDLD